MPNWCSNKVSISSRDYYKLEALATKIIMNKGQLCESILPVPEELNKVICGGENRVIVDKTGKWFSREELGVKFNEHLPEGYEERKLSEKEEEELTEKYGAVNWYDWNCNNKGSKWGAQVEHDIVVSDNMWAWSIDIDYDTAWSPNLGVSQALVDMGFMVNHIYWEAGSDFAGEWDTEEVEVINENGEEDIELTFQEEWEGEYNFEAMVKLDHDLDERYMGYKKDWLEKNNHGKVGELCMFGENKDGSDKPIGMYLGDDELFLFSCSNKVDMGEVGEHGDYIYFDRYSELGEELGWDDY